IGASPRGGMWVIWCGLLPSAFMTQIWLRGRQQLVPNRMCVPSGDQSGLPASRLGSVSRLTPPPLAFITQTALMYPPRLLAKAIWCPFGEYSGTWLAQLPPSSFLIPDPSAFITSRSQTVRPNGTGQWENTILRPSGDQDGCWFTNPAWLVSWRWALPSAFITQIWPSIVNTIRVPSGENSGEPAAWPLATCVSCRKPVPSGLMVKICGRWLKEVSNTILPLAPGNAACAGPAIPTSPTAGPTSITAAPAATAARLNRLRIAAPHHVPGKCCSAARVTVGEPGSTDPAPIRALRGYLEFPALWWAEPDMNVRSASIAEHLLVVQALPRLSLADPGDRRCGL